MNRNSLFVFLFIVTFEIRLNVARDCVLEYPFQWIKKTCHPYDYCLAFDDHRWRTLKFSTKTGYRLREPSENLHQFDVENCTASNIWLLVRHGTRLPNSKGIKRFMEMQAVRDEILENVSKLKKPPLCVDDLSRLKQWKWNHSISSSDGNLLMPQGYIELASIARNFRHYLPTLFDSKYDEKQFHFRHTNTERTASSFKAFFNELFGESAHKQINAVSPLNQPDYLLKAYANCHLWTEQKKRAKNSESEMKKFETSDQFRKFITDVNHRFGFNGTLTFKRIKTIFDLCKYEQAWQPRIGSIWCSLFTSQILFQMEYRDDLVYYYKSSHGSRINRNMKCAAISDMLNRLSSDTGPKTTVYFSHSAALQLFLTGLGALRDNIHLKADNFDKMSIRKWKTSDISPFAGNIAVVRYKCRDTQDQVKFYLNEKQLHFDWCKSNGACDWDDVQHRYAFYKNGDCDKLFCSDSTL